MILSTIHKELCVPLGSSKRARLFGDDGVNNEYMAEIDIILLACLCCTIAVAVALRRRRFVQVVSILIFLGAIWVSIFEMYTFGPRLAVSKHKDAGANGPRISVTEYGLPGRSTNLIIPTFSFLPLASQPFVC